MGLRITLSPNYPDVRLVELDKNYASAVGTILSSMRQNKIVVLLNNDVMLNPVSGPIAERV
jgi:hypothetical protein